MLSGLDEEPDGGEGDDGASKGERRMRGDGRCVGMLGGASDSESPLGWSVITLVTAGGVRGRDVEEAREKAEAKGGHKGRGSRAARDGGWIRVTHRTAKRGSTEISL